jgi:hypothetical protein
MKRAMMCVVVLSAAVMGCDKVVKNTHDKSAPGIELSVRSPGGAYTAVDTAQLSAAAAEQLDIMCTVRDPDGVKHVALSFSHGTDGCNVNSAVYSGVFTVAPVPDPLEQSLSGDASGKVLTVLPMLASLKGPFSCNVPGAGKGVPYGAKIQVTCQGSNWASDASKASAQKVLVVSLH